MYDPVLTQQTTEVLSRLFSLIRGAPREVTARLNRESAGLSPDLLSNIRQFGSTPTPRQLQALKLRLSLTIGGAFKLFGYAAADFRAFFGRTLEGGLGAAFSVVLAFSFAANSCFTCEVIVSMSTL